MTAVLRKDFEWNESYILLMTARSQSTVKKQKLSHRCYISEFASPEVRWVENATCPLCGGDQLMDAYGMALCVPCNKFVKPKRRR